MRFGFKTNKITEMLYLAGFCSECYFVFKTQIACNLFEKVLIDRPRAYWEEFPEQIDVQFGPTWAYLLCRKVR